MGRILRQRIDDGDQLRLARIAAADHRVPDLARSDPDGHPCGRDFADMKWLAGAAGAPLQRDKTRFRPAQQLDGGVETGLLPSASRSLPGALASTDKASPPCDCP
jgi:hypothetical protein